MRKFLLVALALHPFLAEGARSVKFPIMMMQTYHDYTKSIYGDPQTMPVGTAVKSGVIVVFSIQNDSNLVQSGTLELLNTSPADIFRATSCCPPRTFQHHYGFCGITSSVTTSTVPRPVTWSASPNSTTSVTLQTMATQRFGDYPNVKRLALRLNPLVRITVDQDRGAIRAAARFYPILSMNVPLCGGSPTISGRYGSYLQTDGIGQLFQVNGDRPF